MLKSVQGVFKQGKIELNEVPENITDETQVIVTFLSDGSFDLSTAGINPAQAFELRQRLSTFEDWNSPEMGIYDNYDASKSKL